MRVIVPAAAVVESLRGSPKAEDPAFRSRGGQVLDWGRVRICVRQAAEQAGIGAAMSPHWLRHAHASRVLDHTAPIHLVQATLGQAAVPTTSDWLQPAHSRALATPTRKAIFMRECLTCISPICAMSWMSSQS